MLDPLADPAHTMPRPIGTSAFRTTQRKMARWLDGDDHAAARHIVDTVLAALDLGRLRDRAAEITRSVRTVDPSADVARVVPVSVLAEALGFADPAACASRQALISAALLTLTEPVTQEAEVALGQQLIASGRTDPDEAANVVALLHQCFGATAALIDGVDPPVAATIRISPEDAAVEIPLAATPYGRGPHACPAREHAAAIAAGVIRGSEIDDPGEL